MNFLVCLLLPKVWLALNHLEKTHLHAEVIVYLYDLVHVSKLELNEVEVTTKTIVKEDFEYFCKPWRSQETNEKNFMASINSFHIGTIF